MPFHQQAADELGGDDLGRLGVRQARQVAAKLAWGQHNWNSFKGSAMSEGLTLASVLLVGSGLFCLSTLFFGTKGGYYDSDDYDGNGTAH
ncbi:MAG: hypothetical protein ACKO28_00965 [Cyanobium sp.]